MYRNLKKLPLTFFFWLTKLWAQNSRPGFSKIFSQEFSENYFSEWKFFIKTYLQNLLKGKANNVIIININLDFDKKNRLYTYI